MNSRLAPGDRSATQIDPLHRQQILVSFLEFSLTGGYGYAVAFLALAESHKEDSEIQILMRYALSCTKKGGRDVDAQLLAIKNIYFLDMRCRSNIFFRKVADGLKWCVYKVGVERNDFNSNLGFNLIQFDAISRLLILGEWGEESLRKGSIYEKWRGIIEYLNKITKALSLGMREWAEEIVEAKKLLIAESLLNAGLIDKAFRRLERLARKNRRLQSSASIIIDGKLNYLIHRILMPTYPKESLDYLEVYLGKMHLRRGEIFQDELIAIFHAIAVRAHLKYLTGNFEESVRNFESLVTVIKEREGELGNENAAVLIMMAYNGWCDPLAGMGRFSEIADIAAMVMPYVKIIRSLERYHAFSYPWEAIELRMLIYTSSSGAFMPTLERCIEIMSDRIRKMDAQIINIPRLNLSNIFTRDGFEGFAKACASFSIFIEARDTAKSYKLEFEEIIRQLSRCERFLSTRGRDWEGVKKDVLLGTQLFFMGRMEEYIELHAHSIDNGKPEWYRHLNIPQQALADVIMEVKNSQGEAISLGLATLREAVICHPYLSEELFYTTGIFTEVMACADRIDDQFCDDLAQLLDCFEQIWHTYIQREDRYLLRRKLQNVYSNVAVAIFNIIQKSTNRNNVLISSLFNFVSAASERSAAYPVWGNATHVGMCDEDSLGPCPYLRPFENTEISGLLRLHIFSIDNRIFCVGYLGAQISGNYSGEMKPFSIPDESILRDIGGLINDCICNLESKEFKSVEVYIQPPLEGVAWMELRDFISIIPHGIPCHYDVGVGFSSRIAWKNAAEGTKCVVFGPSAARTDLVFGTLEFYTAWGQDNTERLDFQNDSVTLLNAAAQAKILHITGHFFYNDVSLMDSAITALNDDRAGISLGFLQSQTTLMSGGVVILNLCESGRSGTEKFQDDISVRISDSPRAANAQAAAPKAFATTFLAKGASCVIATLREVDDLTAFLFTHKVMQLLREPGMVANAVDQASLWLKALTSSEAANIVNTALVMAPDEYRGNERISERLDKELDKLLTGPELPFADPLRWTSYVVYGKGDL